MTGPVIKVTSKSFSSHPVLREELRAAFPGSVFNDLGRGYTEEEVIAYFDGADGVVVGISGFVNIDVDVLAVDWYSSQVTRNA